MTETRERGFILGHSFREPQSSLWGRRGQATQFTQQQCTSDAVYITVEWKTEKLNKKPGCNTRGLGPYWPTSGSQVPPPKIPQPPQIVPPAGKQTFKTWACRGNFRFKPWLVLLNLYGCLETIHAELKWENTPKAHISVHVEQERSLQRKEIRQWLMVEGRKREKKTVINLRIILVMILPRLWTAHCCKLCLTFSEITFTALLISLPCGTAIVPCI